MRLTTEVGNHAGARKPQIFSNVPCLDESCVLMGLATVGGEVVKLVHLVDRRGWP
jgi:hypothetical protein